MSITLTDLTEAVAGGAVGARARIQLEPLGGPGDKVFPSTYGVDNNASTKYAMETRRVGEENVESVVLDSVASQANRQEAALLDAVRNGDIELPVVSTDFRGVEGLEGLDRISSLDAPHRVYDALLRDSLLDDQLFRLTPVGQAITEATVKDAAALFHYSPTTLLFGGWDSTGPKGGRGSKFERAITTEIVGLNVRPGVKTSSRIDPAGIELKAGPVYEAKAGGWTLDAEEAVKQGKDPKPYSGSGEGAAGRPSQINHGNITPSIDDKAGGVTVDSIEATTVLSFVQLRRLRFPTAADGTPFDPDARRTAELAGRTAIAALGLAAAVLAYEEGFDLRSRCVLVATDDLGFELVRSGRTENTAFTLDRSEAIELLTEASAKASAAGLGWNTEEVLLTPTARLVELIRRSQALTASESED